MGQRETSLKTSQPLPMSSEWELRIDPDFDVLGPFPIHAREQHFLSPTFPIDPRFPIDFTKRWPSSYADGGDVSWSRRSMLENRRILLSYPEIRWNALRATEGWAALQHHSVVRIKLTVHPPSSSLAGESPPFSAPQLSVGLEQGSFFALLPAETHLSRIKHTPEWHSGNIYAMGGPTSLVQFPVSPSSEEPTSYDLFISADYEIRLFGDPRARSEGSEVPTLDISLALDLVSTTEDVVRERSLDVMCDFVDGFAFGQALGVGFRSVAGWWTVQDAKLVQAVSGITICLLNGPVSLAPGQARSIPILISQSSAIGDIERIELEFTLESPTTESITHREELPVTCKNLAGDSDSIKASYFFASSMPTAFVVKQPTGMIPQSEQPGAPILVLHGAGVDVLTQPLFAVALPSQKRSWIIIPTGRTPWGLDWHGPSADEAWSSVSALRKILDARDEWRNWRFPSHDKVVILGHSNGGQGAWYQASRWPDRVLAVIPAAAYIKAQAYVPLTQSRSAHFIDPMLRAILESAYTPDDNDLFLSNVAHIPIWAIHGGDDNNVPVWHTREAVSIVKVWNPEADIKYMEDKGQLHWYPDVFRRPQIQDFLQSHLQLPKHSLLPENFTLTAVSPSDENTLFGWKILSVHVLGRLARLSVQLFDGQVIVTTSNVCAFRVGELHKAAVIVQVDSDRVELQGKRNIQLVDGSWKVSDTDTTHRTHYRISSILQTSAPLTIIIPDSPTRTQLSAAQRIAHQLQLFYKLDSDIVFARNAPFDMHTGDVRSSPVGNVVAIGDTASPHIRSALLRTRSVFNIADTTNGARLHVKGLRPEYGDGAIFLHPHPLSARTAAMLVFVADDDAALERIVRLFPSRTGISVPDWVVIGPVADSVGAAGVKSAG